MRKRADELMTKPYDNCLSAADLSMMKILKIEDRESPQTYLLDWLSGGLSTLASLVGKKHDFIDGNFFILAPDSVDVGQLSELGMEIRGVDHPAAIRVLASVVKRFIAQPNRTVLLQDFIHRTCDPHWEEYQFKDRATMYNGEVYWEIKGPDTPDDEIVQLIADWSCYFPVSAFFCASQSSERKKHLTKADLENLADHVLGVVEDVFDGDSFLIWYQDDLQPLL